MAKNTVTRKHNGGATRKKRNQNCLECKSEIMDDDKCVKCCKCKYSYHTECVNISQRQYRSIMRNEKWECDMHVYI